MCNVIWRVKDRFLPSYSSWKFTTEEAWLPTVLRVLGFEYSSSQSSWLTDNPRWLHIHWHQFLQQVSWTLMLPAFTCSWVATCPPSPLEDHVSDFTSTKVEDTNCLICSSLGSWVLFLRCLASRLTWVCWQQRIKEIQEVFTLVRRWIFSGVKHLCMHLFSQGQPLLSLFLDYFLLQACLFAMWPYNWFQALFL